MRAMMTHANTRARNLARCTATHNARMLRNTKHCYEDSNPGADRKPTPEGSDPPMGESLAGDSIALCPWGEDNDGWRR